MPKKVPNIQRIINDILKIVNIVFSRGAVAPPCHPAVFGPVPYLCMACSLIFAHTKLSPRFPFTNNNIRAAYIFVML